MSDVELLESFAHHLRSHIDSMPAGFSDDVLMTLILQALQDSHARLTTDGSERNTR